MEYLTIFRMFYKINSSKTPFTVSQSGAESHSPASRRNDTVQPWRGAMESLSCGLFQDAFAPLPSIVTPSQIIGLEGVITVQSRFHIFGVDWGIQSSVP